MKHGNDTLVPFDFITAIGKAFDTPLIAIKGFYIELEDGEYKSIKIDWNRLNKRQKECLKMMFVEAKWIYNYIISQEDIKSIEIFMQQIT